MAGRILPNGTGVPVAEGFVHLEQSAMAAGGGWNVVCAGVVFDPHDSDLLWVS